MQNTPPDTRRARRRRRRVRDEDRKRAPRACRRCKTRKNKCIETANGVCERCLQGSHACIYDTVASPDEDDEASRHSLDMTVDASYSETPRPGEQISDSAGPVLQAASDLASTHQTSDCTSQPKGVLTDNTVSERLVWPGFLSRLRDAFSLDPRPAPEEQEVISMQASIARPPPQPAEIRRLQKAIAGFPPRPVAEFLLSVCIEHGTDSFFYFDQDAFAAELDQFYSDQTSRLRHDSSFVCLALATFALGSQWTTLAKPESARGDYALPEDTDPGRIFYNHARTLVPDILDRQCVRSVQAAFVLGVYLMPASAITASYVYMGLALRKAVSLGLHLEDADDPHLGQYDKEIQRRLWWAIFALERTTTVKLNRPRSISQGIITVSLPYEVPSIDRRQKFDNIQHQIADARWALILDHVSEVSMRRKDGTTFIHEYLSELKGWKSSLPPCLRLENVHPRSSSYRAVLHLYLNYYFAKIAALKISVVTAVRARLRSALIGAGEERAEIGQDVIDQCGVCTRAAKKVLELFRDLATTKNVTRFSFTDFQGCSIATIIVLVAGILERDSAYAERVEFGLDCLRRMAGGNVTAKIGIRFVEAVRSIADEARDKLCRAEAQHAVAATMETSDAAEDRQAAEYNRWAAWLAAAESIGGRPGQGAASADAAPGDETLGMEIVDPALLPRHHPGTVPSSSWEDTETLHQHSETSAADLSAALAHGEMAHQQHHLDFDANFSAIYSDDQHYLMGLTGLDVLSFAGPLE